jgi:hypothetical protein
MAFLLVYVCGVGWVSIAYEAGATS